VEAEVSKTSKLRPTAGFLTTKSSTTKGIFKGGKKKKGYYGAVERMGKPKFFSELVVTGPRGGLGGKEKQGGLCNQTNQPFKKLTQSMGDEGPREKKKN